MMKLLESLLLLSALSTAGYSLVCNSCWNLSGVPCSAPSVTCPSNNVCVASLTSVRVGNVVTPQYTITCGTPDQCNLTGSMSFNYGTVRTGTSCCSTDNCTPTYPTLPSESLQSNGLTCRSCSSDSSDYCYTSETQQCTGEERKCGRMEKRLSGTINQKEALRGCATQSFCDILGTQNANINGLIADMKMYCSDGAADLRVGYLFSIFTALLTKFIF